MGLANLPVIDRIGTGVQAGTMFLGKKQTTKAKKEVTMAHKGIFPGRNFLPRLCVSFCAFVVK